MLGSSSYSTKHGSVSRLYNSDIACSVNKLKVKNLRGTRCAPGCRAVSQAYCTRYSGVGPTNALFKNQRMLALVVSARNSDCPTQGELSRRSSRDPSGSEGGLAVHMPVGEISVRLRMRVPCSKMARATNSPVNDNATTSGGLLKSFSHSAIHRAYCTAE